MAMWDDQVKALAGEYRILRYDTRGHGGSDAPSGDYSLDRLPESSIVAAYGGQTVLVPLVEGRSTTNVIRRLQQPAADGMNGEGKCDR